MGSEISRQMRDGIRKQEIVIDYPDQNNGTKLLNYCIVISPRQEAADSLAPALNEKKREENKNVVHGDKRRKIDFLHVIIDSFTQEPISHRQPIVEYHFSSQEIVSTRESY
ncbi:hypothetical protein TNCV_571531 [Trichonephila clavipes]|nr:hypothetical protein TNCV_571531 [Trichonephila clavipes]